MANKNGNLANNVSHKPLDITQAKRNEMIKDEEKKQYWKKAKSIKNHIHYNPI